MLDSRFRGNDSVEDCQRFAPTRLRGYKHNEKDLDFYRDCVMVKAMKTLSINNTIKLPPDIQREVEDFALFLIEKRSKKRYKKLSFAWAGALRTLRYIRGHSTYEQ